MYVNSYRRKKINLWLLILIILFIIAIVFTAIHMMNSSRANSDERYSKKDNETSNVVNKEYSGSKIGKVDSYSSFSDIEYGTSNNQVEMYNEIPEDTGSPAHNSYTNIGGLNIPQAAATSEGEIEIKPVEIDGHTYSFQNIGDFQKNGAPTHEFVELKKGDYLYRVNIQKSAFDEVLHKDGLKSYIESTFNVQVTSELKTGTINDLQMILCTIADSTSVGYFVVTPFNESEVLCVKIYDVTNPMALIKDLSEPLNDISSIKTNIQ